MMFQIAIVLVILISYSSNAIPTTLSSSEEALKSDNFFGVTEVDNTSPGYPESSDYYTETTTENHYSSFEDVVETIDGYLDDRANSEIIENLQNNENTFQQNVHDHITRFSENGLQEEINEKADNYLDNVRNNVEEHKVQYKDNDSEENKIKALEKLRNIFGINWNPLQTNGSNPLTETPQFMLELYNAGAGIHDVSRASNPYDATIVRSYIEKNNTIPGYFTFNLTGMETNEVILEAELHVFRISDVEKTPHPALFTAPYYLLRVYQVLNDKYLHIPDMHKLLNVHYVNARTTGWQVFNVKQAVLSWLSRETQNMGLLITATTVFGDPVELKFARRNIDHNTRQPILVLFNDDGSNDEHQETEIHQHWTMQNQYHKIKKRSLSLEAKLSIETIDNNNNATFKINDTRTSCSRQDLYVKFKTIGLSDWIVAPEGFSASQCRGQCNFPLDLTQRPTNHALILSLINFIEPDLVQKPCCAPTVLKPLSILYMENDDSVVLKNYKDMIVDDCGCR